MYSFFYKERNKKQLPMWIVSITTLPKNKVNLMIIDPIYIYMYYYLHRLDINQDFASPANKIS